MPGTWRELLVGGLRGGRPPRGLIARAYPLRSDWRDRTKMTTDTTTHTASQDDNLALAQLGSNIRPEWPAAIVTAVLQGHAHQADAGDLAVAAIRAAQRPHYKTPKTIGWRGPHWDGCRTSPNRLQTGQRCGVCGKPEDLCETQRAGLDDDHDYEPTGHRVTIR